MIVSYTLKRRDIQGDPLKYLDRLTDVGDLRQFVFEGGMEHELYGEPNGDKWPPRLAEAMKLAGVDPVDVERKVVAEERAEPEVRKPDEKPLNAKPKPAPKPAKVKKGAKK